MSASPKKFLSLRERSTYHRLEDVIGCKWSIAVIAAVGEGVRRPGELERYIPGISKKILNERLRKLCAFGVLSKEAFDESLPRVEYRLTPAGRKLIPLLARIRDLGGEFGP
jgi:DNA-binding HxlR family transcriptional regulator